MGRVLLIGLDGATWDVLGRWVDAGRMPQLAALRQRGAWGTLRSTVPPVTLPGWSSFMTGRNPGGHGVFGFRRTLPDRYEEGGIANASDVRAATMWDFAGQAGKQVGLVSVPPSYPLPTVNGFVVGCLLTPPGQALAAPADVVPELGEYVVDVRAPLGLKRGQPDYVARGTAYLSELARQARQRTEATLRLMRRPWDVFCVVYYTPDRVQHYFWPYVETPAPGPDEEPAIRAGVNDAFAAVDASLGALLAAVDDDTTVILVSDHGCGPKPAQAVYVNRWLANRGYLEERPLWRLRRRVLTKIMSRARRTRYDTAERRVDRARTRAWGETLDPTTVGIWINVAGRYPFGCVDVDAYEPLRDRLIGELRAFRNADGKPVFVRVERREDLYTGAYVDRAPDVLASCGPGFGVIYGNLKRDLRPRGDFGPFEELGFTGTHDQRGIYLFAGAGVQPSGVQREYPIESIAPTTLHLLGLPVPRTMEGPVCTDVLCDDFVRAHPVEYTDDDGESARRDAGGWKSADDEAQVWEHLHALGYVE